MRNRGSVDSVGAALMAALGLLGACGGMSNGRANVGTKDADSPGDGTLGGAPGDAVAASGAPDGDSGEASTEAGRRTCIPCLSP